METLALTTGKRKIKDGSKYNKYFPPETLAYGHTKVLKHDGNVQDTVKYIARMIESEKSDTAAIAQQLKGRTRRETVENIHKFMINYLQYDTEKGEKLRAPRRTWWVGQKQKDSETGDSGVDCDDMVIFSGSILRNLNIPFYIRIVKIDKDDFQHVYIIVPAEGNELSGTYLTLDGVITDFNFEYPYREQETFNLRGMKIEYLGALQAETAVQDPVKTALINLYKGITANDIVTRNINRQDVRVMLNYAITHWDDPAERTQALAYLADQEAQYYPDQHFFRIIATYPSPAFFRNMQSFLSTGVVPVAGLSGNGDIGPWPDNDRDGREDNPAQTWNDPYGNQGNNQSSSGGSGKGWDVAVASIYALAQVDWAALFGKKPPMQTPPYQLDKYGNPITPGQGFNAQIAGYSITSIALLAALVVAGVYGYKKLTETKKQTE